MKSTFKKGIIIASLLFLAVGCSNKSQSYVPAQEALPQEGTEADNSEFANAQSDSESDSGEMPDVSIATGMYQCKPFTGKDKGTRIYLHADGSYEREDGQKGFYSYYRPDPGSPEHIMYITWTSGPNTQWDDSSYRYHSGSARISLGTSDTVKTTYVGEFCNLVEPE